MVRYMYDSVDPAAIPASATMVAGYADGRYANLGEMRTRFPRATVVSIAVRWTTRSQVLDVETGDATPAEAVQWCTQTMADKNNHELTVYCNTDTWPTVRAAFRTAGVTEPQYLVAQYDGNATIPAGAIGKQYENTPGWDRSVVADYWPGVDPAPSPAPPPAAVPQWRRLLDHVMAVPEGIYEHWVSGTGWDNVTPWGAEYAEQGVPWCVIWDWCMYNETGLAGIVPKTDNVAGFTTWAQQHGQWSEYPSVGAWVNFGGGAHTEIVVGFDATTVYTKGGNSVQAGATDNGQGNGVWSHSRARTDTYVTGYLAPRFPDGHCPPTADPHDPRGGTAQTSYTWPGPAAPAHQETDMPQWHSGQITPGPQPTVVLVPRGNAWSAATHRTLHLGMDQVGNPAAKATVRVAVHNGTAWGAVVEQTVTAAGGTVDVDVTGACKVSLECATAGVAYAVETW